MKPLLILCLLISQARPLFAQKETNLWYYGDRSGITFNGGSIQNIPGVPSGPFYTSTSYADENRNLKFIFNGNRVLDRNYNTMPGSDLLNMPVQGHIILAAPSPANPRQFYLFYATNNSNATSFVVRYAIIDMSLNGGLGQVISANTTIDTLLCNPFTLVQQKGSNNFWIITHKRYTTEFHSWLVTAAGISASPVVSQAGTNGIVSEYDFVDLKTSPNGEMIAGTIYIQFYPITAAYPHFLEVFNIDAATGLITNKVKSVRQIHTWPSKGYLEFSPDNRLLYAVLPHTGMSSSQVWQYNLCYTDSILFTRYAPLLNYNFSTIGRYMSRLQMAPDKKLYARYVNTASMSAIQYPNIIGTYSGLNLQAHTLTNDVGANLPTFYHAWTGKAVKNNIVYDGGCYPAPLRFSITSDIFINVQWDFGDPGSGGNNASGIPTPDHQFSAPGLYTVSARLYAMDGRFIETVSTLVEIKDPAKRLLYNYPADTVLCGNGLKLRLSAVNGIFEWSVKRPDGTISILGVADTCNIASSGIYYVEMIQNDCDGCKLKDSIEVTVVPQPSFSLGPDTYVCTGDSIRLQVNEPNAGLLWNTSETTGGIYVKTAGTYWLRAEYNNNGCPFADTIEITERPGVQVVLPNDTTLCPHQSLLLDPAVSGVTYLWQNNSVNATYLVTQAGKYWVEVNQNGCYASDTVEVTEKPVPLLHLGNDTTICEDAQLLLNTGLANCLWQDNSTAPTYLVNTAGKYWVRVTAANGCVNSDTIFVNKRPLPDFVLGNDTVLCEGDQLNYNFRLPAASYTWSTGNNQGFQVIGQAGYYWLEVIQDGCYKREDINVAYKPLPQFYLGDDTVLCENVELTLNANYNRNYTFTWQNNSSEPTYIVNKPGAYWARAWLNGCSLADTIHVNYKLKPVFSLGDDTVICKGQPLVLKSIITDGASYVWHDGSTWPSYTATQPGIYTLTVTNECGSATDNILVTEGTCLLVLPNAFSPNNNGKNDVFGVKYPGSVKDFHMMVFNRWGQKVFETYDPYKGWDGIFKGMLQPNDAYVWVISLTDKDGVKETARGIVTLVR